MNLRLSSGGKFGVWFVVWGMLSWSAAAAALDFPQNPQQWLNSPPLSFQHVAGKGVLLYFFNHQDPDCHANWKVMADLAKRYEDQPVLFLAISSGGQRNEIDGYAKQLNLDWPILLDVDRAFEKKCPVTELSADNGMQVALLDASGKVTGGSWEKPEDGVKQLLLDARWTVNPDSIPDLLKPAWRQIEFQNYSAAAIAIKKASKSPKDDIKDGAEALLAVVTPRMEEKVAAANAAYDAGEKWPAYRTYAEVAEQFKGYELPDNVEARRKELQSDPDVKPQVAAMKAFDAAKKQALNPAQKKKGIASLRKLIKDKPDTEAAEKAKELVNELEF